MTYIKDLLFKIKDTLRRVVTYYLLLTKE